MTAVATEKVFEVAEVALEQVTILGLYAPQLEGLLVAARRYACQKSARPGTRG